MVLRILPVKPKHEGNMERFELGDFTALVNAKRRACELPRTLPIERNPSSCENRHAPHTVLLCFRKNLGVVNQTGPVVVAYGQERAILLPEYTVCFVYAVSAEIASTNHQQQ